MDKQVNEIPLNGQPDLQVPIDGPRTSNDVISSPGTAPTNAIGPVPKVALQANTISAPLSQSLASGQITMDQMLMRILEDLPAIAGLDRDYRLRKGDVITLPPMLAKTLLARKKAVQIQIQ